MSANYFLFFFLNFFFLLPQKLHPNKKYAQKITCNEAIFARDMSRCVDGRVWCSLLCSPKTRHKSLHAVDFAIHDFASNAMFSASLAEEERKKHTTASSTTFLPVTRSIDRYRSCCTPSLFIVVLVERESLVF